MCVQCLFSARQSWDCHKTDTCEVQQRSPGAALPRHTQQGLHDLQCLRLGEALRNFIVILFSAAKGLEKFSAQSKGQGDGSLALHM